MAGSSGVAAAALLRDVRRLAEETLRVCRPDLQEALRGGGVPLDDLIRLLRLLQRLVSAGAGRLLEPGDTVRGWAGQGHGKSGWGGRLRRGGAEGLLAGCEKRGSLPCCLGRSDLGGC